MQRRKNIYNPNSKDPFNVSRSKIDFFLECPQCFYLDRRLGIVRPSIPGYTLNMAVDSLLKKEFDVLREQKKPHALMQNYAIEAIPFWHPDLAVWRDDNDKKIGASFLHQKTNLNVCGIIDDIWQNTKTQELHIVDYKSTSTDYPISLNSQYKEGYKRQMEIYQWIFRKLGFPVSKTGYFFYVNATKKRPGFHGKLEFEAQIIPYEGNDAWIESAIENIKKCLDSPEVPLSNPDCEHCNYRALIKNQSMKTQMSLIN